MEITTLSGVALLRMQAIMERAAHDPRLVPAGLHAAPKVEPGLAMLVEPINADPFVFVLPGQVVTFVSESGSGTDRLRKRIDASLFFERVVEQRDVQEARSLAWRRLSEGRA